MYTKVNDSLFHQRDAQLERLDMQYHECGN